MVARLYSGVMEQKDETAAVSGLFGLIGLLGVGLIIYGLVSGTHISLITWIGTPIALGRWIYMAGKSNTPAT